MRHLFYLIYLNLYVMLIKVNNIVCKTLSQWSEQLRLYTENIRKDTWFVEVTFHKTKNQQRITTTTKSANQTRNLTITSSRECARLGTRLWFVFKWRLHLCCFGFIWEELDPESHQRPVENVQIIKDNWKQSTSMTYEIFVKNQKDKKSVSENKEI